MEVHLPAFLETRLEITGGSLGLHCTPISCAGGADGYKWAIVGPKHREGPTWGALDRQPQKNFQSCHRSPSASTELMHCLAQMVAFHFLLLVMLVDLGYLV